MISLIIYDFDVVMTNNCVMIDQFGHESAIVNRSDGLAVSEIKKLKIKQIIISTEINEVVERRAEKLGIQCIHGVKNKRNIVEQYLLEHNIDRNSVLYIGNDINDIEAMNYVGFPISPKDAHSSIRNISKYVTESKGGEGVIREVLDYLIENKMV